MGWGHKYSAHGYSPAALPAVMEEYPSGLEITEIDDPTVEEEQAMKAAQEEALEGAEDGEDLEDDEDDD